MSADVLVSGLLDRDTVIVMNPERWRDLRMTIGVDFASQSDFTAWRYQADDFALATRLAYIGVLGGPSQRSTIGTRRDLAWRMEWYRDPGSAWWEQ